MKVTESNEAKPTLPPEEDTAESSKATEITKDTPDEVALPIGSYTVYSAHVGDS